MSLADQFVLAGVNADPGAGTADDGALTRTILNASSFQKMLTVVYNDLDFGPFVNTGETPEPRRADRRWLRIAFLLAQVRDADGYMAALWWLDRPNESLDWISPFEATANDEGFARANALVFLTGGRQVEPDTIEEGLLADFCSSLTVIPEALSSDPNSLLVRTFRALHEATGSLATARLMLTCGSISGERGATLYRLVRESDAETVDQILRTQFGYAGEGLDH